MSQEIQLFQDTDGVRVFADHSRAESPKTQAKLEKLIADAHALGCEEALVRNDHNLQYLTDESRARYVEFLNIGPDERVLEIGASMGQHTQLIARRCAHLDAFEVVPEQARFARLWCDEKQLGNVRVSAGGTSGFLPFETGDYDLVTLNYVLEWCAGRANIPAQDFHLQFLTEIARVLRPGGRLFISTKNRYGLRLLLGSLDEHMGRRFGSALPRWIGRWMAKARQDGPGAPQGYLHSRTEFEALLRDAGFTALQPIFCFPDARFPQIMAPFDDEAFQALGTLDRSALSRSERLYTRLPGFLKRRVAISHAYVATKDGTA